MEPGAVPSSLHLALDEVHIWWVVINLSRHSLSRQVSVLSPDERARAERFQFERHRLRYIAGRAWLRMLLGRYLGLHPAQIEFEYSPLGKPTLKNVTVGPILNFNLSNSDDRALIAFRWQHLLGIDLELIKPMPDEDDFARQFFCASETALIHSLSGEVKSKTFFELWTCKEALLKAMGTGLTTPINEVQVSLDDGNAHLVSIAGDPVAAAEWRFSLFQPAPGFQAALALTGPVAKISLYPAPDEFNPG